MGQTRLTMPAARDFGWTLKPNESAHFDIHKRPNGQFSVVLNHALLRGVRAEMIHWWFRHFTRLSVHLTDTPGYEGRMIEVGTFENHLPVLFAQNDKLSALSYSCEQDPAAQGRRQGFDRSLFEARVAGFSSASDAYEFQAFDKPSFL